jgi:hypothetical protein
MDDTSKKAMFFNPKNPLTPTFIPLIFWLGVIMCVIMAIGCFISLGMVSRIEAFDRAGFSHTTSPYMTYAKAGLVARAIALLTLGPLFWFVICEFIAVFFHMNKNLETLKQTKIQ